MLCEACDLSNTITQRCTAKTALTPFSMCHGMLSSLHLTFWRQTGAEEAAEETLIPNFSPCHYGPVRPPIRCLWVMWETLGPVLPTPAGQTACSVQTKLKTTRQTQLRFTSMKSPGSICPLCGRDERSLDINLSFIWTHFVSSSFPFSPHLVTFLSPPSY